jgi:hypothetical protein
MRTRSRRLLTATTLPPVRRLHLPAVALAVVLVAVGCGSSSASQTTTPPPPPKPGPGQVLFEGTSWAVVVDHGAAHAQHLVRGAWESDASGVVKIDVLGPKPGSTGNPRRTQFAAQLRANAHLVESGLWVDGVELLEKGGGLSPTRGTIYGTTVSPLKPGKHTAVAYARTAVHGTAVAWTFSV